MTESSVSADLVEAQSAFKRGDLARARAIAEARLAREPNLPLLQHLLGLIHCRQGTMDTGIEWLKRASDGEPDSIAYRVMLARALTDSGRAKQALGIAAAPAGTSPPELALWHARAEAAQKASEHAAAAEAWHVLCAARPDDWRSWANYGDALAGLDRWPDAANALRRAASLNPKERPLQENLASALARAGFHDEAVDQLTAMLDSGLGDIGVRLTLARLLADLGRQDDSMVQLDRAAQAATGGSASGHDESGLIRIALGERKVPGSLSAETIKPLRELALLFERTNRMEPLRNLLNEAEQAGVSRDALGYPAAAVALRDGDGAEAKRLLTLDIDTDPVRWNRLMAKIFDALGDPEGAFAAAVAMNRAVSDFDGWIRRGAEYRRRIRSLAATVTPEWSAKLRPLGSGPRSPPAFLVGFPRSGTTLLDTFLMGHPETEVLEERHMVGAAETVLGNIAQLPLRSSEQLEQARKAYFAELDRHVDPAFTGLIVDKLPLNMLGLPAIYTLFPDARIIFAQRHPCDAVLSAFMQSFTLNDAMACFLTIEDSADFYDAAMTLFTRSQDALPLAFHTLVYEELIIDPGHALQPLIEFLGLEWRPELLDHQATAKARGTISTPSYDQVVQPLSKAPSGRWRRYETQLAPVLPILLPWAELLGYAD